MDGEEDWNAFLRGHPIFSPSKAATATRGREHTLEHPLELSLNTLPDFTKEDMSDDGQTPSGRRQVMVIKDSDIIVATGSEIRMASLGDTRLSKSQGRSYKVCLPSLHCILALYSPVMFLRPYQALNTPNVTFDIHQMVLNPNGKFLAVAGASQVAIVVLPRAGFTRLVPTTVDCKCVQLSAL